MLPNFERKRTSGDFDIVLAVANFCPLASDRETDFHPVPRFRQGGADLELFVRDRIFEPAESFEIEEYFSGVEIGILIAEKREVAFVGLGGDRDVPFVVPVVVGEMIESEFRCGF